MVNAPVVQDLTIDSGRRRALEILEEFIPVRDDQGDALSAVDISIAFGGLQALKGVSITVQARHMVGLIGPNGAGKSTLFDIVNGLKKPDSGSVYFFGKDVTATKAWDRAGLGMSRTFQSNRITQELTVADNLLAGTHKMIGGNLLGSIFGVGAARTGERRAREAAWSVAQLLDIHQFWDDYAGSLDFGAQRRIEIGRSLLSGPRLLLLDEPSAGLDARESGYLFSLIKRLHQDLGLTVLLVEHYVKAVLENCDYVYVLNQGEMMAAGNPEEIANNPDVREQYLGTLFEAAQYVHGGGKEH